MELLKLRISSRVNSQTDQPWSSVRSGSETHPGKSIHDGAHVRRPKRRDKLPEIAPARARRNTLAKRLFRPPVRFLERDDEGSGANQTAGTTMVSCSDGHRSKAEARADHLAPKPEQSCDLLHPMLPSCRFAARHCPNEPPGPVPPQTVCSHWESGGFVCIPTSSGGFPKSLLPLIPRTFPDPDANDGSSSCI